jgi:hypothetical protein
MCYLHITRAHAYMSKIIDCWYFDNSKLITYPYKMEEIRNNEKVDIISSGILILVKHIWFSECKRQLCTVVANYLANRIVSTITMHSYFLPVLSTKLLSYNSFVFLCWVRTYVSMINLHMSKLPHCSTSWVKSGYESHLYW